MEEFLAQLHQMRIGWFALAAFIVYLTATSELVARYKIEHMIASSWIVAKSWFYAIDDPIFDAIGGGLDVVAIGTMIVLGFHVRSAVKRRAILLHTVTQSLHSGDIPTAREALALYREGLSRADA